MKSYSVTIQMKPLQQYFHMILLVLYIVVTFESADEILWYYHSNETLFRQYFHKDVSYEGLNIVEEIL